MSVELRVLGYIPARAGSQRVPRKNLRMLGGRPLVAWTIDAAMASKALTRTVVSTDSEEIADVARQHGADVPFLRPPKLAANNVTNAQSVFYTLERLLEEGDSYDCIMILQPTSPLRSGEDIDGAAELLVKTSADAVCSVCEVDHPPEWSNALPPDRSMRDFVRPEVRGLRSQQLPVSYRLNGAVYLYRCDRLLRTRSTDMYDNCYAYVMSRERSVDMDTDLDFAIAEAIIGQWSELHL